MFVSHCFPSQALRHPHSIIKGIGSMANYTENHFVIQLYNIKHRHPLLFMATFLAHNVSLLKVKFVNFRLNLPLCPRCPEVIRSLSPPFQFL